MNLARHTRPLAPALALAALLVPARAAATLTLSRWEAGTCSSESCTDAGDPSLFYTQAAGHPDFGITDFAFATREALLAAHEPTGKVRDVRVDLPAGLAVDPEATPQCAQSTIEALACPTSTQVGEDEATGTAALVPGLVKTTVTERFPVFNVQRREGEPARFGVEVKSTTLALAEVATKQKLQGVIYLEGGLSWYHETPSSESSGVESGDYHEYFKIQGIPQAPEIVESKLIFWGVPGAHDGDPQVGFITLPSTCSTRPVTHLHLDSYEAPGSFVAAVNQTPVSATGCGSLAFVPSFSIAPETSRHDEQDGATFDLHVPQPLGEPGRPDSPTVESAEVTLPAGMTLNPAAAHELQACTNAEIGIGTNASVRCPAASVLGAFTVDAPGIPRGSLAGTVYVASPEAGKGPESGGEFRVFLAAYSQSYGVGLRLEGRVRANVASGRLAASFAGTPQVPFEDFVLHMRSGTRMVLANPLQCGPALGGASLTPYTGQPPTSAGVSPFTVDLSGTGKPCPAPLPFALSQSLGRPNPALAGAYSPFGLRLGREGGQGYPARLAVTLPEGVLGAIPSVKLCAAAQAAAGTCPSTSQIGVVSALAGAGPSPYQFSGRVYLTGPYEGAPYGLSIVVPAVAGPYDLGSLRVRAGIDVGMYDGRITATAPIPTVFEGVPLRLRALSVDVNRHDFLFNPTSCAPLPLNTTVTSSEGAVQQLPGTLQVSGCNKLKFTPSFAALAGGRHLPKVQGTSFSVRITQGPHQANIRTIVLQLPRLLSSRQETLEQACPVASFEAGPPPGACQPTANVGSASVLTPVLPGRLTGPVYLVSHGGAAFPDLDLILHGDGVTVVLVGHTHISPSSITTSSFENLPDVPISSVSVSLPAGRLSALGPVAALCGTRLLAPTTIVSQSGVTLHRNTSVALSGCPLTVVRHRLSGRRAIVTVLVPSAGTLTVGGRYLRTVKRRVGGPGEVTLSVPLSGAGVGQMRAHRHRLSTRVRVRFLAKGQRRAVAASVKLTFR